MKALLALLSLSLIAHADRWPDTFSIEKIKTPTGIDPQIGGLATLPDQRLIATFHRGEVMIYDPDRKIWSLFADGLHEPLGLMVEDQHKVLVMQRSELTRLTDTDGDGVADRYTTVYDDFGMSGNYHEFAFGPVKDEEGNLYISLGVASNGAGIRPEIRGEWNPIGQSRELMLSGPDWKERKNGAGRMYGRVPWRGWIIKITPEGKGIPIASGVRSPNGIGIDKDGRLLVCDNQGDWLGTSKLHHIREDHFHGHPASLIWRQAWTKDPLEMDPSELDQIRTRAAGLFPQGELANSPTQPISIPDGIFPSATGDTLIGEMNQNTLVRFLPDSGVKGASQGTTIPFLQTKSLGRGNNRLTFTKDGSLWVGKTHLSWPGAEGLLRIRQKEKNAPLFLIKGIELGSDGFTVRFSQRVDPSSLKFFKLQRHTYNYHAKYGSEKVNLATLKTQLTIGPDHASVFIPTKELLEDYLYTFHFDRAKSSEGKPLLGHKAYYHLVSRE